MIGVPWGCGEKCAIGCGEVRIRYGEDVDRDVVKMGVSCAWGVVSYGLSVMESVHVVG